MHNPPQSSDDLRLKTNRTHDEPRRDPKSASQPVSSGWKSPGKVDRAVMVSASHLRRKKVGICINVFDLHSFVIVVKAPPPPINHGHRKRVLCHNLEGSLLKHCFYSRSGSFTSIQTSSRQIHCSCPILSEDHHQWSEKTHQCGDQEAYFTSSGPFGSTTNDGSTGIAQKERSSSRQASINAHENGSCC